MRNGADSLCGPLNHRKWLHVHHWEYKQRWQFGHTSVVMIAIDADDAIASLSTRRPLLDILILRTLFAVWLTGIICFCINNPPTTTNPFHPKARSSGFLNNYNFCSPGAFSNGTLPHISVKWKQSLCAPVLIHKLQRTSGMSKRKKTAKAPEAKCIEFPLTFSQCNTSLSPRRGRKVCQAHHGGESKTFPSPWEDRRWHLHVNGDRHSPLYSSWQETEWATWCFLFFFEKLKILLFLWHLFSASKMNKKKMLYPAWLCL